MPSTISGGGSNSGGVGVGAGGGNSCGVADHSIAGSTGVLPTVMNTFPGSSSYSTGVGLIAGMIVRKWLTKKALAAFSDNPIFI